MNRCTFYYKYGSVSTTAKIPSPLSLSNRLHQGENWKLFRREWKFYELAAAIHKKALEVRVALLLNVIGKEGIDMYETLQWGNSSDALKLTRFWKRSRSVVSLHVTKLTRDMFFSNVSNCQINRLIVT